MTDAEEKDPRPQEERAEAADARPQEERAEAADARPPKERTEAAVPPSPPPAETPAAVPRVPTESYEAVLEKNNGVLVFTPGGTSMMPLLHHHENPVVLVKPSGRLNKGDVAFYKRGDGQYVLHRVIKVLPESYLMCGDNQVVLERGITDGQILAVMSGFYRGERFVSVDDPAVVAYVRRRMASRPFRALYARAARLYRKVFPKKPGRGKGES